MPTANVFKDGAMRKVTLYVRFATRSAIAFLKCAFDFAMLLLNWQSMIFDK